MPLTYPQCPMAAPVTHRQGRGALVLHGDHQVVEALVLAVGWGGPRGDLATDAVHAEGHVVVARGDVVGQNAVDPDVTISSSHLDHGGTPAHVLGREQETGCSGVNGTKCSTCCGEPRASLDPRKALLSTLEPRRGG